jgi:hypothetical protein
MPITKQEVVETLTGYFQIGMFEAPCKAPHWWLAGCCCCCCMAGKQRNDILDVIGEPYVCCGGEWADDCCALVACGLLDQPMDRNCLWVEALCCPCCAIDGNRFLIQTRFDRMNTACDECILWTKVIMDCLLCRGCGMDPLGCSEDELLGSMLLDCICLPVSGGCMLAQQQHEIEYMKKTGFAGVKPTITAILSPNQQHMISQAKPPAVGAQTVGT